MRRERVERSHERPHPDIVADDRRLRFARMRALYCTGRSNKRNAGTRFNGLKTCVPYRSGFIDCSPAKGPHRCRIGGDTGNRRVERETTRGNEGRSRNDNDTGNQGDDGSVSAHATVAAQLHSPHAVKRHITTRASSKRIYVRIILTLSVQPQKHENTQRRHARKH